MNHTMPCRVCGKPFVPCGKSSLPPGSFNYREVACSPKCGAIYLARVVAAREKANEKQSEPETAKSEGQDENEDSES